MTVLVHIDFEKADWGEFAAGPQGTTTLSWSDLLVDDWAAMSLDDWDTLEL